GRCAVQVETAGGMQAAAGARPREPIAPILRLEQLPALLGELQPGLDLEGVEWRPVHRRAFGRMLRAGMFGPLVAAAVAAPVIGRWAVLLFGVLVVLAAVRARLRARHLGWALLGDSVVVR